MSPSEPEQLDEIVITIAHGIDVSKWQRDIDWKRVATESNVTFAYVRAFYGSHEDEHLERNVRGAKEAGLHVGVYQYFKANESAEKHVAALMRRRTLIESCDLPFVLDVEKDALWLPGPGSISQRPTPEKLASIAHESIHLLTVAWLQFGAAMVYTNLETGTYLEQASEWECDSHHYDLWAADYSCNPPRLPPGWTDYAMHQYTCAGTVPGIAGNVDLNFARWR
jgi:lysozyme